jgi:hypothetical protein
MCQVLSVTLPVSVSYAVLGKRSFYAGKQQCYLFDDSGHVCRALDWSQLNV